MVKNKLWLTYAWHDNQDLQVDFIVQELKKGGIDVRFDRVHIIPGQRLWPQIEKGVTDSDAWGLVVSKASLESQPCREELAYALDRAMSSRDDDYPILGIFVEPIDRALIPGAIRTRLYTNIRDENWVEQVRAGVERRQPNQAANHVDPFIVNIHPGRPILTVECRPRAGRWIPCVAAVPSGEKDLISMLMVAPAGYVPGGGMASIAEANSRDGKFFAMVNHGQATPYESMYISLKGAPTALHFGSMEQQWVLPPNLLTQIRQHFAAGKPA